MAAGIPALTGLQRRFTLNARVAETHELGATQFGRRKVRRLDPGTVEGPELRGTSWDGSLDLELTLANGVREIEQLLIIHTDDGAAIYARVCGVAPGESGEARVVLDFEAPLGSPHTALNRGSYVGRRVLGARGELLLEVYAAGGAGAGPDAIRIEKASDHPSQSWDCATRNGQPGSILYESDVALGDIILVGDSKRGLRNVIPIVGGALSGGLQGSVLRGGADFQLFGSDFSLYFDARYLLRTADGELVLVRNCGPLDALVPVFEARAAGPYAWLNEQRWFSDPPGLGLGTVHITVRDRAP
jgi:hypothetical protein